MGNPGKFIGAVIAAVAMAFAAGASAQEVKHYRFAHDQQLNSGYSIAYDIFSAKLKELSKVDDLKGYKVRVQATATEDAMFAAYGAQTVHMPFGSVYTSLQTGVMDFGENAVNVYLINKHYEVAPVLSMTEHEANNAIMWISDKLWQNLSAEQKQWVTTAARDVSVQEPKRAFELERSAAAKLEKTGVKIVTDVDKPGFQKIADPYLDKLAKGLGPHADKIKTLIRAIN